MSWQGGITLVEALWNETVRSIPKDFRVVVARDWVRCAVSQGCDSGDLMGTNVGQVAGTINPHDDDDEQGTRWAWKF